MIRPGFLGKGGCVQALKNFWFIFRSDPPYFYPFLSVPKIDRQDNDSAISYG